jgi:hypothetical protein
MVEISMFGSGEGPVWATGRGYSTTLNLALRAHSGVFGPSEGAAVFGSGEGPVWVTGRGYRPVGFDSDVASAEEVLGCGGFLPSGSWH